MLLSRTSGRCLLSAVILGAVQFSASFCPAQAADEKGFVLKQFSQSVGHQTVYLTPTRLKAVSAEQGTVTVARAPAWDIVIYSPTRKAYFQTPLARWKGPPLHTIMMLYGLDVSSFELRKLNRHSLICGQRATLYLPVARASSKNTSKATGETGITSILQGDQYNASRCHEFWCADDVAVPKEAVQILSKMYAVTAGDKVPLKLVFLENSATKTGLQTLSCKEARLPGSDFAVPAGYKKAARYEDLVVDLD